MIRMEDASAAKKLVVQALHGPGAAASARRCMDGKPVSFRSTSCKYALGNVLIYGPLRNTLGFSRVRVAYTAGEAIGPDLFSFYRSIGINLKQLYGSTETAVFVCLQPDNEARSDTVGVPIDGVEIKLLESGEIMVRSRGLLKELLQEPEAATERGADGRRLVTTRATPASSTPAGHLKIIDRAKDVGPHCGRHESMARCLRPSMWRTSSSSSRYIKEAVAFGDKREKVCAFINIDFEAVGNWAERHNLPYGGLCNDLAQKPEVLRAGPRMRGEGQCRPGRRTSCWPAARSARFLDPAQGAGCGRRRAHAHPQGPPRLRLPRSYGVLDRWRCMAARARQFIETAGEVRGRSFWHRSLLT